MFRLTPTASLLMLLALVLLHSLVLGRESPAYIKPVPKHFGISLYLDSHNQTELSQLATHYLELGCGFLNEVHVVSNSPLDQPTKNTIKKYFNSVHDQKSDKANRFKPHPKSSAQIYLLLSKAVQMTCGEMEVGLRKYQQNVIVEGHFGPIVAYQASSAVGHYDKFFYIPISAKTYNFAVDAFFASKHHLQLLDIPLPSVTRLREIVKETKKCEELALNFIVNYLYPELTTIKLDRALSDYQQQSAQKSPDHDQNSSQSMCINSMAETLGSFPSRYLNMERQSLYRRPDIGLIANITDKKYQYYNSLMTSKQPPGPAKPNKWDKHHTFAILGVTHTRNGHNQVFMQYLQHYATLECPSLTEVNIVWNNDKSPKQLEVFKDQSTWKRPVNFVSTAFNSLIHRFHIPEASKQLYYLSLDDDLRLTCQQMTQLLEYGLKSAVGEVGLIPLTSNMARRMLFLQGKFNYRWNADDSWAYNLGITNVALLHRHHLEIFWMNEPKINGIRKYMEMIANCQDIAMNFVYSYFYPQLDTLVPQQALPPEAWARHSYGGVSSTSDHLSKRTKCVNAFSRILGQASPKDVLRKKAPARRDADLVQEVLSAKVQYYNQMISTPHGSKRDSEREEYQITEVSRQVIHEDLRVLLSPQIVQPVVQEGQYYKKEKDSELVKSKEEHSMENKEMQQVKQQVKKAKEEILEIREENSKVKDSNQKVKDEVSKVRDEIWKVKEENSKVKEEVSKVKEDISKVKEDSSKINEEILRPKQAKNSELDQAKQLKQKQLKKEIEELREIISLKQQGVESRIWQINGWAYLSCALAVIIALFGFKLCRRQRQKIDQSSKAPTVAKGLSIEEISDRRVNVLQI